MKQETIRALKKQLKKYHRKGPGNQSFPYYKYEDIVARMNEAFGHDWSNSVLDVKETDDEVLVRVRVSAGDSYHEQYGRASIKKYSQGPRQGTKVNYGNDFKSAVADGIKKCAELFGVGCYEEGEEDTVPETSSVKPSNNPVVPPVSESITVSTKSTKNKVDMEAIQKVMGMLEKKEQTSPSASKLASSFVDISKTGEQDLKATDVQKGACTSLSRTLNITEPMSISEALPGSIKKTFEDLTKDEAKIVIKSLQQRRNSSGV